MSDRAEFRINERGNTPTCLGGRTLFWRPADRFETSALKKKYYAEPRRNAEPTILTAPTLVHIASTTDLMLLGDFLTFGLYAIEVFRNWPSDARKKKTRNPAVMV